MVRRIATGWAFRLRPFLGGYRDVVWLVGDGRSGTTWVADLINHDGRYRQMFEPVHPRVTPGISYEDSWPYLPPEQEEHPLAPFFRKVFRGALFHPRVDRYPRRLRYKDLLIKDIFGHLAMAWVHARLPKVRKVLLLRHPCAVAASKRSIPEGRWMSDPRKFLEKPRLVEQHLEPFEDVIRRPSSYFERQITIWCILHLIVMRQMTPGGLHLLFYEDLCDDFHATLRRLWDWVGRGPLVEAEEGALGELFDTPSETSREDSAIRTGTDRALAWKGSVTPAEEGRAGEILARFGLDGIYDESGHPSRRRAEELLGCLAQDERTLR